MFHIAHGNFKISDGLVDPLLGYMLVFLDIDNDKTTPPIFLSKTPGILQKRSEELRYNFANRIQAEYTAYKTSKTFNYLE